MTQHQVRFPDKLWLLSIFFHWKHNFNQFCFNKQTLPSICNIFHHFPAFGHQAIVFLRPLTQLLSTSLFIFIQVFHTAPTHSAEAMFLIGAVQLSSANLFYDLVHWITHPTPSPLSTPYLPSPHFTSSLPLPFFSITLALFLGPFLGFRYVHQYSPLCSSFALFNLSTP